MLYSDLFRCAVWWLVCSTACIWLGYGDYHVPADRPPAVNLAVGDPPAIPAAALAGGMGHSRARSPALHINTRNGLSPFPEIDAAQINDLTLIYRGARYGEITANEAAVQNAGAAVARLTPAPQGVSSGLAI